MTKMYISRVSLQPSTIYTMHKFGYRIVRDNYLRLGLEQIPKILTSSKLKLQKIGTDTYFPKNETYN